MSLTKLETAFHTVSFPILHKERTSLVETERDVGSDTLFANSQYPLEMARPRIHTRFATYRNLLYTAVTRAKSCVVILGSRDTVAEMVANGNEMKRNTGLIKRIHEYP